MTTTKTFKYTRKDDLASADTHEWGTEKASFLGTWLNTGENSGQIGKVIVTEKNDEVYMQCFGAGPEGLIDWGTEKCALYSSKVDSPTIEGFSTHYQFDFMKTLVAGNVKYGIMVIQTYNQFQDGSDRNNYFSREFFRQQ